MLGGQSRDGDGVDEGDDGGQPGADDDGAQGRPTAEADGGEGVVPESRCCEHDGGGGCEDTDVDGDY